MLVQSLRRWPNIKLEPDQGPALAVVAAKTVHFGTVIISKTTHWPKVGSMLDYRLRRWPNIEPPLNQCVVFTDMPQGWVIVCNVGPTISQNRVTVSLSMTHKTEEGNLSPELLPDATPPPPPPHDPRNSCKYFQWNLTSAPGSPPLKAHGRILRIVREERELNIIFYAIINRTTNHCFPKLASLFKSVNFARIYDIQCSRPVFKTPLKIAIAI